MPFYCELMCGRSLSKCREIKHISTLCHELEYIFIIQFHSMQIMGLNNRYKLLFWDGVLQWDWLLRSKVRVVFITWLTYYKMPWDTVAHNTSAYSRQVETTCNIDGKYANIFHALKERLLCSKGDLLQHQPFPTCTATSWSRNEGFQLLLEEECVLRNK